MKTQTQDEYTPAPSGLAGLSVAVLAVVAIAWALAAITGASAVLQGLVVVLGIVAGLLVGWAKWRHWKVSEQLTALVRKNLTGVLRTPLPRGAVRVARPRFGAVFNPGPPRTVTVRGNGLPVLDAQVERDVLRTVGALCEQQYVVDRRHSKEGRRIVLREKPEEPAVDRTPREQVQARIQEGACEVFPKSTPQVECRWDEDSDEDFLAEVVIRGIPGMELSLVGKRRQALQKLRTRLPQGAFTPEVDPRGDTITFRRSKPLPAIVVPPKHQARPLRGDKEYRNFQVALGVADEGQQATWSPVKDAHLLIIGGTGGGKTIAEHGVIQRLTQAAWRCWLIDGKQIEFTGYNSWPNVEFLAQDVDSQIRLLYQAHETMTARYKLIREGKVSVADLDPIAMVIDELTSLLEFIDQRYQETKVKGMPTRHPALKWVANLARLGRSAKIHLVVGLQRPDAAIMGGELRDNFGGRLSLGKLRQDGSIMMWDDPAVGVQVPPVKGRGIAYLDGAPVMVQGTYTANPDAAHPDYHPGMIEAARPVHNVYSRKHVAEVIPEVDDEGNERTTWAQLISAEILGPDQKPVVFDPVTSDESRALRQAPEPTDPGEDVDQLQIGTSFEQAINLFTFDPCARLHYGASVARRLHALAGASAAAAPASAPVSTVATPEMRAPSAEVRSCELREVVAGQSVLIEDLGEDEVMVSRCEPTDDDPTVYAIHGYTPEGDAVSAELPADTVVETLDYSDTIQ